MFTVTIEEANGWITEIHTDSRKELAEFRKRAQDMAMQCLPFNQYLGVFKHLVYYYEMPEDKSGRIEVKVLMNPRLITDHEFYDNFVNFWKPTFVGAIHRR